MLNDIKENMRQAYNNQSELINRSFGYPWIHEYRDYFVHIMREYNVKTILEIGCGSGRDAVHA